MFTLAKAIIASGALIYGAANVEQASEHFDDFAMQIPGVLGKKIQSVMKHGSKAILMEDSETKAAAEKMIGSLVQGLRHIGDAMAADMVRSAQKARG